LSRVRLHEDGLPAPELQENVYDENGRFIARVDFSWMAQRTVGEFDGKIKYGKLRKPGQSLEERSSPRSSVRMPYVIWTAGRALDLG
jgi:hypothetical protein